MIFLNSRKLELLNKKLIFQHLGDLGSRLHRLEVLSSVDSTNTYLLQKAKHFASYAVFAEQQTAGRGQCNRKWVSRVGKDIALSVLWQFPHKPCGLTGLSLAMGVAVVRALKSYGLSGIQLKWPNDVGYQQKKLGGILLETRPAEPGFYAVVSGIGLNLDNPLVHSDSSAIDQAVTDISSIQNLPPQRNLIAGLLLKNILIALAEFQDKGFIAFIDEWESLDSLRGNLIDIQTSEGVLEGIAKGVNQIGQLRVDVNNKPHYFSSGDIRIIKKPMFRTCSDRH